MFSDLLLMGSFRGLLNNIVAILLREQVHDFIMIWELHEIKRQQRLLLRLWFIDMLLMQLESSNEVCFIEKVG